MKIAVSGASGKTGYRIAEEAIKNGHQLKLIVRKGSILPESLKNCEKVAVDLANKEDLDRTLKGTDALIIATGARPSVDLTGPARVDALGVTRQVESCKRIGINRIILVSSLCAGKLFHPLNLFGLILIWKRCGEDQLQKSNLEWTIIRPGGLTEREDNLDSEAILYSSEKTQEEGSIPRRLVARCCVDALSIKESVRKIIEITSNENTPRIKMREAISRF